MVLCICSKSCLCYQYIVCLCLSDFMQTTDNQVKVNPMDDTCSYFNCVRPADTILCDPINISQVSEVTRQANFKKYYRCVICRTGLTGVCYSWVACAYASWISPVISINALKCIYVTYGTDVTTCGSQDVIAVSPVVSGV